MVSTQSDSSGHTTPDSAAGPESREKPTGQPAALVRQWLGRVSLPVRTPAEAGVMAAGVVGVLLIAVSYLSAWLTATLEHRGVADSESLRLDEVTTAPLAWMYRLATLAMVGCAVALLFAPWPLTRALRIAGFSAAGLSLFSALVVTLVITTVVSAGAEYFGDGDTIGYGAGLYAGYLGIAAVASFIGLFGRLKRSRAVVVR